MSGSTFILEIHKWRGFERVPGPLFAWTTLGFLTVAYAPFLLKDWFKQKLSAMFNVLEPRRFPEMAVYGDEPTKVPHQIKRGRT